MSSKAKKILMPIGVIVIGFVVMAGLSSMRPEPNLAPAKEVIPLITVKTLSAESTPLIIKGTGTVRSESEIMLVPEVGGKLVYRGANTNPGARFKKGELLYRIDQTDYALRVKSAKANVAMQDVQRRLEEQQQVIAKQEWDLFKKTYPDVQASDLTLRKPQQEMANANYAAAQANLELAELNLRRTRIYAPFNGSVRSKRADVGQYVAPGTALLEVFSTDMAQIDVYLDPDALNWLDLSGDAEAIVSADLGGKTHTWKGTVKSGGYSLDRKSRLINVTVNVPKPYDYDQPLLNGLFVNVQITGRQANQVFVVPRTAIHNRVNAWVLNDENRMEIRTVRILKNQGENSIITEGLKNGDRLILSNLEYPVENMKLRTE